MSPTMTRNLAAWIFLFAAGCATARPGGTPPERLAAPDPRHGIPPTSPEMDPAQTEQRFGIAEAKARKEAKARAERDRSERLGVVSVGGSSAPRATAPAPTPAKPADCPCDAAPDPGAHPH
jgi:hypothetical protein